MEVKFALVTEGISVDMQTNQLSLFNILEGIEASGFPVFIQRITFIVLVERDMQAEQNIANGQVSVQLGDNVLNQTTIELNFQNKRRCRAICRYQGLVVPQPGALTFRLTLPNTSVVEYVVDVTAAPVNVAQPNPA